MTYLDIVNKILVRLREPEVTTVQENSYSKLIGEFVNVVKREVEDAWNWNALRSTITVNTVDGVYHYSLTGSGTRSRVIDVINDTENEEIYYQTTAWFNKQFLASVNEKATPAFWNINGINSNGDMFVDLFPIPNAAYAVRFNVIKPQADLDDDADEILVPALIVIEGVLARAISERGEDGGYQEQELRYQKTLSDLISIEAGQFPAETVWYAV
jgi:hypothetical protein